MNDIAAAIGAAPDLVHLHTIFHSAAAECGFDGFAAGCLRDGDRPITMFLQHWPSAWVREYMANGYGTDDSLLPLAIASPATFTWAELWARGPYRQARVFAAAIAFGWRDGLMVPIHGPGEQRGMVSLASRRPAMTPAQRPAIEALCALAYRRGQALAGAGAALTSRERDALVLVAAGHDDAAIAEALGIARATAHAHVERAKRRLGARSRAHAVAVAAARNLI